jgi:ornithine cyclodeaminase
LSAVLSGKAPGRTSERDVTIFDSVGFALEDFSTLRYLYRLHSEERGAHRQIDLVPDLEDPKNLFARLAAHVDSAPISGRFAVAQRA